MKAYLYVGGNLAATEEGDVGTGSGPPAVPDGRSATTPLRAVKLDGAGSTISLSFGTSCAAVTHEILYGGGSQLPASYGGTYGLAGAACGIGASSPYTWSNAITPTSDAKRFDWFIAVATDGSATEGPWGKNSGNLERTGPGSGGSSGRCAITTKSLANTCGATLTEDEQAMAEVLAREGTGESEPALANTAAYFYAWDHLGTVRLVMNDTGGTLLDRHDYEPFGIEVRPVYNQSLNTHRFTGHERDDATRQDYAHFRYIAAGTARFTRPDTFGGSLASPQSMNLYSYVGNSPVNLSDPSGHFGTKWGGGGYAGWIGGGFWGSTLGQFLQQGAAATYAAEGNWAAIVLNAVGIYDSIAQGWKFIVPGPAGIGGHLLGTKTGYQEWGNSTIHWSPWQWSWVTESASAGGGGDVIPPPEGQAELRSLIANWMQGKSYLDLNFSMGFWGGGTGGIMFNGKEAHLYLGGGFVTPGGSASLTWSPNSIATGWGVAGQGTAGAVYQRGYATGGKYEEIGVGGPLGITIAPYYVFSDSLW